MSIRNARLGETSFAVVDLETTGIYPTTHDRIIEIAILKVNGNGEIQDEYATLVNPERDIGRHDLHGISASDVVMAPCFREIAGDIASRLEDSIVVGHHLRFDLGFLKSEFFRLGVSLPQFPSLCTLELSFKILPEIPSRKLGHCCEAAGIRLEGEHSALEDARATAALLACYLERAKDVGSYRMIASELGNAQLPGRDWISIEPSGQTCSRLRAAARQTEERRYLARLIERMLGDEAKDCSCAEYLLLLDRALEDRLISRSEAEALVSAANAKGITRSKMLEAHRAYLSGMVSEALSDGVVSAAERRDLESVCDMLDLNRAALDEMLASSQTKPVMRSVDLTGKSVCFTGELMGELNGDRVTRDMAEHLAATAGLIVQPNVTRRLDLLVVADPQTQSGKARKAREYGVRIMAEAAFWKAIRVPVS